MITYQNLINRRVGFLLEECRSENPVYDQAISMIMRKISNYATVERDLGSFGVKKINKNISKSALRLKETLSFEEFHNLTTNEHQYPLKEMWLWMLGAKDSLTVDRVWEVFVKYPFVTITNDEDSKLRGLKGKSYTPEERYAKAGIEVIRELG